MRKLVIVLMGLMLMAGVSQAFYVNSNTFSTSWNTVTVEAASSEASGFINTSGASVLLFTQGDGTTGAISIEAWWYPAGSASLITTEVITQGTTSQVRAPRAKIVVFNSIGTMITVEGIAYGY